MTYRDRQSRDGGRVSPISETAVDPGRGEPTVEQTEVVDDGYGRIRIVRIACVLISGVCALFAIVLAIHIILVLGSANPGNGFAQLITAWANAVGLGLHDLFRPGDAKIQVLLNQGLAAVLWLAIGAGLTTIIGRFGLPGPARRVRYRRTLR